MAHRMEMVESLGKNTHAQKYTMHESDTHRNHPQIKSASSSAVWLKNLAASLLRMHGCTA
jgi:hypothetical protein